jgi:hypothetical protein
MGCSPGNIAISPGDREGEACGRLNVFLHHVDMSFENRVLPFRFSNLKCKAYSSIYCLIYITTICFLEDRQFYPKGGLPSLVDKNAGNHPKQGWRRLKVMLEQRVEQKIFLVSIIHQPGLRSRLHGLEVLGNVIELKRGFGLISSSGLNIGFTEGAMSCKFFPWNESARSLNNQRSSQSPIPPDPVFRPAN